MKLLSKLHHNNYLCKEGIIELLIKIDGNQEIKQQLFDYANDIRVKYYGKEVYMRGLIEFSNICKRDCLYCGIRNSNKNAQRYRLSVDEILSCCKTGYKLGYRTFVLQSGEDYWYTEDKLVEILINIKSLFPEVAITLSIGERSQSEYKKLFDSGADRFLLRHETASKELYTQLHPNMSFDNRVQCLHNLKDIGYQVGAGFMVGLPGQKKEHLAEDLLFLKQLEPDMVGIGPFISHGQTPLAKHKGGTLENTLVMVALTRLFLPKALIPATTAMGTLHPNGREMALKVGANVVMPNISPTTVREKYALYEDKICTSDEADHCRHCIERRIINAGYKIDMGRGDSIHFINTQRHNQE